MHAQIIIWINCHSIELYFSVRELYLLWISRFLDSKWLKCNCNFIFVDPLQCKLRKIKIITRSQISKMNKNCRNIAFEFISKENVSVLFCYFGKHKMYNMFMSFVRILYEFYTNSIKRLWTIEMQVPHDGFWVEKIFYQKIDCCIFNSIQLILERKHFFNFSFNLNLKVVSTLERHLATEN